MSDLHIQRPDSDAALKDWQYAHNLIVPPHPLSLDEVRDRARRHHLEIAYLNGDLVGCSTVRPPVDTTSVDGAPVDGASPEAPTATVIARVLAGHRNHGFGAELYARGLDRARELGAEVVETVVLSSNEDGLRFALKHGFVETERYLLPGDTIPWIDLRLA
jgi:GNAT superfamily N-acetyltransferase